MKVIKNILIYILCISFIAYAVDTLQQGVLSNDMLNEQITTQQAELTRLKEIIKQQDKTIKEQQDIIEKRDKEIEELRTVKARVTAYAPLDDRNGINSEGDARYTANGTLSRRGVIAVDTSKIPYGTKLDIPGYGIASAEDTGYAIRNFEGDENADIALDVLVDTYDEAINWGVKYLDVKIQ